MPIIHPQILNMLWEYSSCGVILSQNELINLINYSNELIIFLEILT